MNPWVELKASDPPLVVLVRLGAARPTVDAGYGGWQAVRRPRRSPLTVFDASPALHMTIPILFDGWHAQASVEAAIRRLEKMARITGSDGTPPRVKIRAQGSHISFQNRTWIIDSLTWGDALMSKNGNRLRQAASVGLLEYIRDTHLADKSASARRRQKATASKKKAGASTKRKVASKRGPTTGKKTILVDTFADPASGFGMGEDLASIAARELGDADRWPEIAQLNGIRDPRAVFPGQVLRLP